MKRVGVEVAHRAMIRERAKTESSARQLKIPPGCLAQGPARLDEEMMVKWGREYQRELLLCVPRPRRRADASAECD
jgi:hypothetical protein